MAGSNKLILWFSSVSVNGIHVTCYEFYHSVSVVDDQDRVLH